MTTIKSTQLSRKAAWHAKGCRLVCRGLMLLLAFIFLGVPSHGMASPSFGRRVAVYVDDGACGDNLLALFRALCATGSDPVGITAQSIAEGCLTKDIFDVFVVPAGENGSPLGYAKHFADVNNLYSSPRLIEKSILNFAYNGGGVIGLEAGAYYSSVLFDIAKYTKYCPIPGVKEFKFMPNLIGIPSGTQAVYMCTGGGYFNIVNSNPVEVLAIDPQNSPLNQAVVLKTTYGKGHVILCGFDPELRWDSDLDWTAWDKWNYGTHHSNSEGAWKFLGSIVSLAGNNMPGTPEVIVENPKGARVALVTTHNDAGGAGSALLPAFARAIEYTGNIPLAIRCSDIQKGYLKNEDFQVIAFPGGTAGGYVKELKGYENNILDFIKNGGSYYGVCAGAYYASSTMIWAGEKLPGPFLGLFKGTDVGPLSEICPWPYYKMTPVKIDDPVIGNLGEIKILYYGGGSKIIEGGQDVTVVATYAGNSNPVNKVDGLRFTYGAGRVYLSGTHPEIRPDTFEDWLYWDKFYMGTEIKNEKMKAEQIKQTRSTTKAVQHNVKGEKTDTPWFYEKAIFNNWLVH